MNARGIIKLQMKKVADVWNRKFKDVNPVTDPLDSIYNEIEDYLPYYVVVESVVMNSALPVRSYSTNYGIPMDEIKITGRILFVKKKLAAATDLEWMLINRLNWDIVCQQLYNLQPEEIELGGNRCYRVPLGSVDTSNQKDINAYLHNLMFWESMLDKEYVGPLSLRYIWVLDKLYTQKVSIGYVNDMLRKANVYKDENADQPEKGVKELCDKLEVVFDSFNQCLASAISDRDKVIAESQKAILDRENKNMILDIACELKKLSDFYIQKMTERNATYINVQQLLKQLDANNREMSTIETYISAKNKEIGQRLMMLIDKHERE